MFHRSIEDWLRIERDSARESAHGLRDKLEQTEQKMHQFRNERDDYRHVIKQLANVLVYAKSALSSGDPVDDIRVLLMPKIEEALDRCASATTSGSWAVLDMWKVTESDPIKEKPSEEDMDTWGTGGHFHTKTGDR